MICWIGVLGSFALVAGGCGRFPYYSHGPIAGFMAGWAAWLQAVFVAPIEVLAAITYVNSALTVNPATLTVTASPETKTYGQVITTPFTSS